MKKFKKSPSIETNMVNGPPPPSAEIQSSKFYTKTEDTFYTVNKKIIKKIKI